MKYFPLPDHACNACEVEWKSPPNTCWVCGKPGKTGRMRLDDAGRSGLGATIHWSEVGAYLNEES